MIFKAIGHLRPEITNATLTSHLKMFSKKKQLVLKLQFNNSVNIIFEKLFL